MVGPSPPLPAAAPPAAFSSPVCSGAPTGGSPLLPSSGKGQSVSIMGPKIHFTCNRVKKLFKYARLNTP